MTATHLLNLKYTVFSPYVDDIHGIDLVSYKDGHFDSIQVRYHRVPSSTNSLMFNVNPCEADTIAMPIGNKICFMPNKRKNKRWGITLSIGKSLNNQTIGINDWKDFLEYNPKGNK